MSCSYAPHMDICINGDGYEMMGGFAMAEVGPKGAQIVAHGGSAKMKYWQKDDWRLCNINCGQPESRISGRPGQCLRAFGGNATLHVPVKSPSQVKCRQLKPKAGDSPSGPGAAPAGSRNVRLKEAKAVTPNPKAGAAPKRRT